MTYNPLISVIIPTYKTNNSLERAIYSVINQTYDNIEIIVVDDNNPNTSYRTKAEEIIQKFKKYKNIKYIKHSINKNGSSARNTGIKHSSGEYISFLDDDDYFLKDKLYKQLVFLLNNKSYGAVACYYYKDGKVIKYRRKNDYTEDILYNRIAPQTSSILVRKNLVCKLNGFNETYFRHQDYEFLLRLFKISKIEVLDEALYVLDRNNVNNIPCSEKMYEIKEKFLKEFDNLIISRNMNKRKIYAKNYSFVAWLCIKTGNIKLLKKIFSENNKVYIIYFVTLRIFNGMINKMRIGLYEVKERHRTRK